jgi:quercetin dioxygenase-like cupin family protein
MRIFLVALHLAMGIAWFGPAWAEPGQPILITPDALKWGPGPPSVPPGAQITLLTGDPGKPGPFTLRIKLPDGWALPAHIHPIDERATVLQGTLLVGTGETWEESTLVALPAGSFRLTPAGVPHYLRARGETIFQVDGVGPNAITYSNPADDPRRR